MLDILLNICLVCGTISLNKQLTKRRENEMKKKVVIIGGGIAGLSAGIYAQKNGFESSIYEKHNIIGGECTAWKRKDYTIDGCLSFLMGVGKGTELYQVWQELGAFEEADVYFNDYFFKYQLEGQELTWYRDIEKLEVHLKKLSPEDSEFVEQLIFDIQVAEYIKVPVKKTMDMMHVFDWFLLIKEMMPGLKTIGKIKELSIEEYASRFKSPLIQKALPLMFPPEYLMQSFIFLMNSYAQSTIGWIKGGSLTLAQNMEREYRSLGGEIFCKSDVQAIIIEKGAAKGISLKGNTYIEADYILPACDAHITFTHLLPEIYFDKTFKEMYNDTRSYQTISTVQVSLGVSVDLSNRPTVFATACEPFMVGRQQFSTISYEHHPQEEGFAPSGKSVIKTRILVTDYEYWESLSREAYQKVKSEITQAVIGRLEVLLPEIKGAIEMIDIATPMTYNRYCGAYKGAYMGFSFTKEAKKTSVSGKIQGLPNVMLATQWLMVPGGLPSAAISGKVAIQKICKIEKKKFNGVS